jgi:hypothetical protein
VRISNVQAWAEYNGYNLTRSSLSGAFVVNAGAGAKGLLLPDANNAYQFKPFEATSAQDSKPVVESAPTDNGFEAQSFGLAGVVPFALDKMSKDTDEIPLGGTVSGTGVSERISDCNYWLPYAAEHYQISRDIRDYVLVPVPAMFSALPNTNGDSLSLKEMLRFDPNLGMQMYKTFKGMPTHVEHANKDITKAKGVILESFLRPIPFNKKYYKIVHLYAFDRTKDPVLVDQILKRVHNSYSVGFYYTAYECSICGNLVGRGVNLETCKHTQLGRPTYKMADGRLSYRKCRTAKGFESSVVKTPAYVSNIGPYLLDVAAMGR